MKIAILSPHRDDAAFSLSLSVRALLAAQHKLVVVCCFTHSEYAPHWHGERCDSMLFAGRVTHMRAEEDNRWKTIFPGDLKLIDLALEDAPLRLGCTSDEVCHFPVANSDGAGGRIAELLQALNAEAVMLPLALGRHVDHVVTRDAVLKVIDTDRIPLAFYEDLPYATRPGAPAQTLDEVQALGLDLESGFVESEVERAKAEQFKLRCVSEYTSQIDVAGAETIASFCTGYGGRERLWATPSWRRSGPVWIESSRAVPIE